MKASLKFREDQRPFVRAKIPISILGLPFLSGISVGDSKELRLDLLTAFESGPSLRASYRPNDPSNPLTVSIKTGVGSFGSPAGAPMSMTAEFNVIGGNSTPNFSVLFKPKFGDFSFKKFVGSAVILPPGKKIVDEEGDASAVWVETPGLKKVYAVGPTISNLLTGVEVSAKSVLPLKSMLPLKSKTAVRFRWGVRVPAELRTALAEDGNRVISLSKLPLLVMRKISIEHLADDKRKGKGDDVSKGAADVAEACMSVRKQLEAIQAENGMLRKAVEELRGSIPVTTAGSQVSPPSRDADISSKGFRREVRQLEGSGSLVAAVGPKKEEMTEELKKALMGATSAGAGGGK